MPIAAETGKSTIRKENPGKAAWSLTKLVSACFCFSTAQRHVPRKPTKGRGFVNVKQVVIGPYLRCTGIVISDECAGCSNFFGSTATGTNVHHVGAQRLRIGFPLGAVRLHS
jgi:hypothetical protein